MEDISPGLLEKIRATFADLISKNPNIAQLQQAVQNGTATYIEAEDFAYHVGVALSEAFSAHLSASVLPDGKLHFNIAEKVLRPMFEDDHKMVSEIATQVQTTLNLKAGIRIKAQTAKVDVDRIDGFINKLSTAENFDDVAWVLNDPVVNYSQAVVESVLKANIDFQGKAGLRPRIIRKAERKCCEWCNSLAGEYDYPDVPDDIYRRHERCRCTVDYDPGTGRRQNVHTKQWR